MHRGSVGRTGPELRDAIRGLDAGTILTALLVLGLLVRVVIAGVYLPYSGFAIDIGDFTAWGQRLASVGPPGFYEEGYFSDYPPGYLYVLWLLGAIGGALGGLVGQDATAALVKIPGMLADLGVATLVFLIVRAWGSVLIGRIADGGVTRRDAPRLGLAPAAIYLFNPGTIFNSAVWGQIDSVGTLVLLLTIYALARGRTELAAVAAVVAMLVKFQFAFLIPLVAIVGVKRHLFGRSTDPRRAQRDPVRVLTSLTAGTVAVFALILPFGMTLYVPRPGGDPRGLLGVLPEADPVHSLVGKFVEAANTYTGLSINAFNLWRNPWSGLGDTLHWGDDTQAAFDLAGLTVTWQGVGTLLFAVVALLALWQVARRDDMRGVLVAALLLAVAFFVLPTRVHERYLFPALALSMPLLFAGRAWPWIAAGISLSFFANVYWVYTEDWSFAGGIMNPGIGGEPMQQSPLLAATLLTDAGIWLLSAMIVVVLLAIAWRSLRLALAPAATSFGAAPESADGGGAATAPIPPRAARVARGAIRPVRRSASRFGWLRPNAADMYLLEGSRRLDRRDALLLLVLVALALVFRLWRLDVPRGQHFDEVYHARSAAEWLANWQNDWDRDVYEWTHPMLAKYLIAAGIAIADPNRVTGVEELDAPSAALAVAPQRISAGRERSVAFTVRGVDTLSASDAETGDELATWEAGGPVATLAFDAATTTLLVGRADTGVVERYDAALAADGRAPPPGEPIETDLDGVSQILVADPTDPIVVRGPNGVAVVEREADATLGMAQGTFGGIALVRATDDEDADLVAVTDTVDNVVRFFDAVTMEPRLDGEDEPLVAKVEASLIGPMLAIGGGDDQRLLAPTGPLPATDEHPVTGGGIAALDADGSASHCGGSPCVLDLVPLPGTPAMIGYQPAAGLVYAAGAAADGAEVWPIEAHIERRGDTSVGLAAFDATALPGVPLAMAFDVADTAPRDDHALLLVSVAMPDGGGAIVRMDAGSNAFAWRLAGVVFGAAMVGLVYLLVATMFARRRVAVLAAAFVAADGMSYVMSRIAMNDIFVAVFIVAAYVLFWQIWSGRWRHAAWWALPAVGVLIGLAAATKWVGFYALAGLLVLVLARSQLGRLVLVGLVAFGTVIGGIGAPWPFLVVMLGLLAFALVVTYARPVHIDTAELRAAAIGTGSVVLGVGIAFLAAFGSVEGRNPDGAVEYLFAAMARGAEAGWPAWLMIGVAVALIGWRTARSWWYPATDAQWYRPGEMSGFAWAWVGACLVVVPLTVYAISYVPYLQLGHAFAVPDTGPGYGWSLDELHSQMFGYHFNLTAGHDSSSPWWSWPMALKATWFYASDVYDDGWLAVIYNGGNPILLWAGIPALGACAVLAWKRRSMALVLIVAAFAFQYVPWIRIERATFAYHYLSALPFAMIGVAYVVDELLRRPAWRDLAVGYLLLAAFVGVLIFPLGSALPMPDWYINAARTLPPWNFAFQFPDPPQGDRAELVAANPLKAVAALAAAALAMAWALYGRVWWDAIAHPDELDERAAAPMSGGS